MDYIAFRQSKTHKMDTKMYKKKAAYERQFKRVER